jgi:hypothetical protein
MAGFNIKKTIEQNVTVWLLTTLLTGFLSGIGVYRAVQDMAGLKTVSGAELADAQRQRAALEQRVAVAEKQAATATAQVKQAYWAVRGTQVNLVYGERDAAAAVEIKERLAGFGALVTLRPLDRADARAGKLFYAEGSRDAAMQIKALISDLTSLVPEDNVYSLPGVVSLWLRRQ